MPCRTRDRVYPTIANNVSTCHVTQTDAVTAAADTQAGNLGDLTIPCMCQRFSGAQKMMLEGFFQRNSHPTPTEQESLAKLGGMYVCTLLSCHLERRD